MTSSTIERLSTRDARFVLPEGAGSDSRHSEPQYSFAVAELATPRATGTGLSFTLGGGNNLVCDAIALLGEELVGRDIDEVMADFGAISSRFANHHQLRWLGPHKGVIHLALASLTNACFDLWAKVRGIPLWELLIDRTPDEIVALLDLSGLEEILTVDDARALLYDQQATRSARTAILSTGYPGYDTSIGWFNYSDDRLRENVRIALSDGFSAFKLKVGSEDADRDIRRAWLLRDLVGDEAPIMLDANQRWSLPEAAANCGELRGMAPYWIEEPLHPDDLVAHRTLAEAIAPLPIAIGEHVPNRVVFKNFMQLGGARFIQVDCTRVGGVSEFITVSLLARKFGLPVVPHVGDMGQIHQHLVLFNHIALGHDALFLEHIPHLRDHFVHPAEVRDGYYLTPREPGSSSDLK